MKNKLNLNIGMPRMVFILAIIFGISSCNNGAEDPKDVAEEHNEEKFSDAQQEKDAAFLVEAAEINLEEIELGKLAQVNTKTGMVKDLGKMMEDEHRKSLNELTALAKKLSISIPESTDKVKEISGDMRARIGKDFDRKYCDMMVDGHKDAISKFEKIVADEDYNPEIRDWASQMLPAFRTHLDHAMDCQKQCEKM